MEDVYSLIKQNEKIIHKVISLQNIKCDHIRKDLEQEILLAVIRSFHTFKERAKFSTWLYEIAKNVCVTHWRESNRKVRKNIISVCFDNPLFEIIPAPKEENIYDKQRVEEKLLEYCTSSLESLEQRLVKLYLKGLSYEEIEKVTGLNENILRVKIWRIKQKMKKSKEIFFNRGPFLIHNF